MASQAIWESIAQRTKLIGGYAELIQRSMDHGFNAYFLSFMFKPLPGPRKAILSQMSEEVQRVYSTFVTRLAILNNGARFPGLQAKQAQATGCEN
jgi:hypothetical protein